MTLPYERTNTVQNVERFLLDLCDPKKTPRVPSAIRTRARHLLKHYPTSFDLLRASDKVSDVFGPPRPRDDYFFDDWKI